MPSHLPEITISPTYIHLPLFPNPYTANSYPLCKSTPPRLYNEAVICLTDLSNFHFVKTTARRDQVCATSLIACRSGCTKCLLDWSFFFVSGASFQLPPSSLTIHRRSTTSPKESLLKLACGEIRHWNPFSTTSLRWR